MKISSVICAVASHASLLLMGAMVLTRTLLKGANFSRKVAEIPTIASLRWKIAPLHDGPWSGHHACSTLGENAKRPRYVDI